MTVAPPLATRRRSHYQMMRASSDDGWAASCACVLRLAPYVLSLASSVLRLPAPPLTTRSRNDQQLMRACCDDGRAATCKAPPTLQPATRMVFPRCCSLSYFAVCPCGLSLHAFLAVLRSLPAVFSRGLSLRSHLAVLCPERVHMRPEIQI